MSEKKQFDEYLGGAEKLPDQAQIIKLAAARASEIAEMTHYLENPHQTKLIFQKLPVHMRRRVMSHNAKRMPRRLRSGHLSQMKKSGLPPKSKRPSRKYRRRPSNLLAEYNRRQLNKFWLETHIWHAKRFKMVEKWGFKLANYSNDRCFRANYRAIKSHCLIQDISYFTCIEITGPMETLKEKLKMHCNPNELTFGAKIYTNGEREGTVMFYKKNAYPCNPIGYVSFMWKADASGSKAIWIWVHPAFYNSILKEITSTFNFNLQVDHNVFNTEESNEAVKVPEDKVPQGLAIFQKIKIPIYTNQDGCQLTILRNCFNRFRLIGPLTLSILTEALKIPSVDAKPDGTEPDEVNKEKKAEEPLENMDFETIQSICRSKLEAEDDCEKSSGPTWFENYYQSNENVETLQAQKNAFNKLKSLKCPSQLPRNMILALTVLDPRFYLPSKRTKSVPNSEVMEEIVTPPPLVNRTPLWESIVRDYVTKNCVPVSVINKLRSQSLVPGVENDEFFNEDIMQKVPIILVQKPGNCANNDSTGFCSGVDIILPARWSMPFWLAFILRSARAGGLRESASIAYETSNLNVPTINHPDTMAYREEAHSTESMLTEKYFRLPSNKRVNYSKFAITSPFNCQWHLLMGEWSSESVELEKDETGTEFNEEQLTERKSTMFYTLRDREILFNLNRKLQGAGRLDEDNDSSELDDLVKNKNCFVPVKVISETKGLPKDFSVICLPTEEDLALYEKNQAWSGPVQSLIDDESRPFPHKTMRVKDKLSMALINKSAMLTDPKKLALDFHLNRLKRNKKKRAAKASSTSVDNKSLPECFSVRNSCDRKVIGYVTQGGFSFREAKGVGLGYVILSCVLNLIIDKSNVVLIRNTKTRQFRFCRLEILH